MRHLISIFIISLTALTSLTLSTCAYANQIIDYATFTQLSRDKQIKVVKMLHEYVTFMEHTQLKSELQKNPSYTQYSKILNYLIQSAHAKDGEVDFIEKNGQACVYAGWVSYMQGGYCRHPKLIDKNKVTDQKLKSYLSKKTYPPNGPFVVVTTTKEDGKTKLQYKSSDSCNQNNQIICSPTLFGTSTGEANGAPFCVQGNGKSYNSSYLCSQAVAKHNDSNKILNGIIENAISGNNRKEFNYLLMSMYDTCMCKGSTGFMNERYAKAMFPSRTCFAWMYQTQRLMKKIIGSSCRSEFEKDNYGNLATVADWMESAASTLDDQINPITSNQEPLQYFDINSRVDAEFQESRNDAFEGYKDQNLCPLKMKPKVKITISEIKDNPLWVKLTAELVGVTRKGLTGWNFALKNEKGKIEDDGTRGDNVYLAKKLFDKYSVTAIIEGITGETTIPKLNDPQIRISEESRNAETATLKAEVTVPEDTDYTIEWSEGVTVIEDSKSATAPINDAAYKVTATLKVGEKSIDSNELEIAPTAIEPTIQISESERDEENAKSILKAQVTAPKDAKYTITWNSGPVAQANDQTSASAEIKTEDYDVSATLQIGDQKVESEPLTIKAIENDYEVKIKLISETDEEGKFKAVVKNNGKVVEDADIKWFKSKKKIKEKKKETRSTGLNTGIADENEEEEEEEEDTEEESEESEDDGGLNASTGSDEDDDEDEDKEDKRKKGVLKAGSGKENSIKKEKFDQTIYATVNGVESNKLKLDKKEEEEKSEQKKVNNSNPVQQQMKRPMPRQRQLRFNMGVR